MQGSVFALHAKNFSDMAQAALLDISALNFDVADCIADNAKNDARQLVRKVLEEVSFGAVKTGVRVNPFNNRFFEEDIRFFSRLEKLDAIFVPDVEDETGIKQARKLCDKQVWAIVESRRGIENIDEIAASGAHGFVFGTHDYAKEIGASPVDYDALLPARMAISECAKKYGLEFIDGPAPRDQLKLQNGAEKLAEECRKLKNLCSGRIVLERDHLKIVNSIFSPKTDILEVKAQLLEKDKSCQRS